MNGPRQRPRAPLQPPGRPRPLTSLQTSAFALRGARHDVVVKDLCLSPRSSAFSALKGLTASVLHRAVLVDLRLLGKLAGLLAGLGLALLGDLGGHLGSSSASGSGTGSSSAGSSSGSSGASSSGAGGSSGSNSSSRSSSDSS